MLGRPFTAEEDLPGGPEAIILGENVWRRRFAADPGVIGRTIQVSGVARTVVGVMPRAFALPYEMKGNVVDAWIPFRLDPANPGSRGSHFIYGIARLRDGATVDGANAELAALSQRLTTEGQYSPESRFRLSAQLAGEYVVGSIRPILLLLLTAVGLVLLIACVNVANLLVERAEGRRREFAVRAALGASRRRLLSQLLAEHAVIGLMGGLAGLGLAALGMRTLVSLAPATVPRIGDAGLDGSVLLFTGALTVVCAMLFGLVPLLGSGERDLHSSLTTAASRATMGRAQQRTRRMLVASEFALAIVLLAGAGLTLRTFGNLLAVDPGFDASNVLTMRVVPPVASYPQAQQVEQFYQNVLERVRALPGVEMAGAVRVLPLADEMGDWSITIEGQTPPQGQDFDGDWQVVAPGYFETMRVRLLEGRVIGPQDSRDAPPVAVINQTMAQQYWPAGDAIGKRFRIGSPETPWIEIVGIVADERHAALNAAMNRRWFRPHAQWTQTQTNPIRGMTLVVRTTDDPIRLAAPVRQVIRDLDANLPVAEVRTLETVVRESIGRQRFTMLLLAVFAGSALLLAAIGVYGVMAFWVTERTREIGVRMALGATRSEVAGMVVRQALTPALWGIVAGGLTGLALTRLVSGLLFGVPPHDPVTFAAAPVLLLSIALLAAWLPARRAARQDPVKALHYE
jgi:putative ABC transport system permease protein